MATRQIPDYRALMGEARANIAALNACDGPHDFRMYGDIRPLGQKWRCDRCGGVVDAIAHTYYMQGLAHGQRSQAAPAAEAAS